ncbi:O-antigen ligase family protein [Aporhodopirellula aestuarii]|uniref:O-antigen ligase family protein n=1 Tax=Aporhodopirellula aestuarii TaxID=2950107 RepID=A0ABT0U978_9BACT|nr:O-antigen ligase family protein [Aporhodopirellula aestuarii]MCM2373528.1 O-antigen ligase family protein [Aporhodopirellula aestuarii]
MPIPLVLPEFTLFSFIRSLCLWISAALLVVIPLLLAVDFGGVYHWSQYLAAIGILVAAVFAIPGLTDTTASSGIRQHAILLPLGILVGYAWFQTLPLPSGVVAWLSPGSHAAYTQWLDGLVDRGGETPGIPLSVSPEDTVHVASLFTILLPLCFAASVVFHARSRLQMLLSAIAIAGASVAILGFYRKLDPTADLWIFQPKSTAFAGFVNRNNAALMLNFGLAASLGLLSWRMMALHSVELDDPDFEFNDLFALVSDRESFVGLLSGTACIAGLLVNGSRGGVVAALFGLMLAFGYVRPRRGLISIPVLIVVLAISVAVLITPMNLNLESISRWEFFSAEADTLQSDGRLLHWQDGWRAAVAHLPGGAGVSAYAYAYLPHQIVSPSSWFEHADNLWLEMLVETGIVGVIVAGWLLAVLLIALNRLSYSADPLDQGMRVAGWYAITAIVVSQFFDMGMAIPANLIAALLLCTAIISRDIANGGASAKPPMITAEGYHGYDEYYDDDEELEPAEAASTEEQPKIRLKSSPKGLTMGNWSSPGWLGSGMITVASIVTGAIVLPGLHQDAISDSMLSRLKDEYGQWRLNPDSLAKMEEALRERVETRSSPLLRGRLAMVQRDRGRVAETLEWRPQTREKMLEIYKQVDLQNRELPYPPEPDPPQPGRLESQQHYSEAWQTCLETLVVCPLAQEPRGSLLRLKPVVMDTAKQTGAPITSPEKVADVAAKHLLTFYAGDAVRLLALGKDALSRGDLDQATEALHVSLQSNPGYTSQVMRLLRENPELSISDVIPSESQAMRLAAADYLKWEDPERDFLVRATEIIRCGEGDTMVQRATCHALVGKLHFYLGDTEKGQDYFQRAIRLAPDQANFRVELIENLLANDMTSEALSQARLGRQSISADARFQRFIDRIAEENRKQLTQPDDAPQVDRKKIDAILNLPGR